MATPNLSASGSVTITISLSVLFASFNDSLNDLGSSGLGDESLPKSPSGLDSISTILKFLLFYLRNKLI